MNFNECREKLILILSDQNLITVIKEELGTVQEMFIASSDFTEMYTDFPLIKDNDFEVEEDQLTSLKQDYCIYALSTDGVLAPIPGDLLG